MWISEQYQKPLYVTSDVIGDGKTVISFRGTGTSMTTGETEEIHRDCVLDFEMHAEVLRSEEEPDLTVSDWNPEEEGQQNQAETIYDPEAGVTVTLRDISNIGASIVIRREDEDAGTEVTYGDAYILQRRIEGEWQDAETIIDDYGFTMIGIRWAAGRKSQTFTNGTGFTEYWSRESTGWCTMSSGKQRARGVLRNTGSTSVFNFKGIRFLT